VSFGGGGGGGGGEVIELPMKVYCFYYYSFDIK
jgi:hypothetical protein